MKLSHYLLLLSASVIFVTSRASAAPLFSVDDDWMRQKVQPPLQTLSVEDALFAFSKAASANVLFDATNIPDVHIKPYAEREHDPYETLSGSRANVITYIANQGQLDYERSAPDTFILWNQPDVRKLTSLAVEKQEQWGKEDSPEQAANTLKELNKFFTTTKGWKPDAQTVAEKTTNSQGIDATWKLEDFPTDLQTPIKDELARQILGLQKIVNYKQFALDYWKTSHVVLRVRRQNVYDENGNYQGVRESPAILILPGPNQGELNFGFPHWDRQGPLIPKQTLSAQAKAATLQAQKRQSRLPMPPASLRAASPQVQPQGINLEGEGILQKRVTFSVRHVGLAQFIADLQKQSGVTLSLSPDLSPAFKVTGCTATAQDQNAPSMPLASAMGALSRLFGAHWDKQDNSYILRSDNLDDLSLGLRQLGYKAVYGWLPHTYQELDELSSQLADEVVGAVDIDALRSDQGVLFSDLPADIQKDVLQSVWDNSAPQLLQAQQRLEDVLAQDLRFRFAPLSPDTPLFFGAFHTVSFVPHIRPGESGLLVYTADGRYITRLFLGLSATPASEEDKQQEEYWNGAQALLKQQEQNP